MKRIKESSIFLVTVSIVSICAVLSLFSPVRADDCTSTLSPDLKVHIPAVRFDTGLYSLDLQYAPSIDGTIWFDIVGAGVVDALNCDNPASLFPASGAYSLYVPSMAYGADKYWMTLQYVPDTAAAQTKTAADSTSGGFKLTNANLENVISPPGTDRVPKSVEFSTYVSMNQGPGGWKYYVPMKSDMITLVEDPLAPLTSPGFSFKPASGFLYIGDDASCSYNQVTPEVTGTCELTGPGIGLFYIDSLTVTDVDTSYPKVTMIYHLWFPANQLVTNAKLYANGQTIPVDPEDVSSIGPNLYMAFHMRATAQGYPDSIIESKWNILASLFAPCNGCGWRYAEKVYPYNRKSYGPADWTEVRTDIEIYE